MKRLVVLGVVLIVGVEALALVVRARGSVLAASGVAVALVLLSVRRALGRGAESPAELEADDLGDSLRRWLSGTESTIRWSESSRTDWDRHLRPMLARRYEIATGQKQSKDPTAYHSVGRMLFGAELWEWVNPNNVTGTGDRSPGPGRAALGEILRKLEQA
ncbi:hypothetical protein BN971_04625 [Mycobacterium bohemicum DSM 44277]|uniref:Uncharacterized protein n=2 Tax=Mycobacterium bohemicum TaxID=56425 RepID=A0A1X1R0Y7_MYCBE|nr:hypothetical protein [Mycobacterium bohemicum]MCV6970231.1 hypothetical protein [Mycobacterium bohemicum]ORU97690.1 hypothetical protein AWB93_17105 [Mycobacterium bohemicum]CPR13315.1 hypothetical protein BN971_04625 [Mycobacterium bohemicum DSM 44277]